MPPKIRVGSASNQQESVACLTAIKYMYSMVSISFSPQADITERLQSQPCKGGKVKDQPVLEDNVAAVKDIESEAEQSLTVFWSPPSSPEILPLDDKEKENMEERTS